MSVPVTFTSNADVSNLTVEVVPELAPFVTLSTTNFSHVSQNTPQSFTLIVSVPKGTRVQTLKGTIHIKLGNGTKAQPLPVTLQVRAASLTEIPLSVALPSSDRIVTESALGPTPFVNDEIDIFFKSGTSVSDIKTLVSALDGVFIGSISDLNFYQIQVSGQGWDYLTSLINSLQMSVHVETAIHHSIRSAHNFPNDPGTDLSYGPSLIHLPEAWDITTGTRDFGVGVVDGVFDPSHVDLQANIRVFEGNSSPYLNDHGTRVASIIGAEANNFIGIAGVMWQVNLQLYSTSLSINPIAFDDALTIQKTRDAINDNSTSRGTRILNFSSGQECSLSRFRDPSVAFCSDQKFQQLAESDRIFSLLNKYAEKKAKDVLWVFSAGNANVPITQSSPARLSGQFSNVISVSAVDSQKRRWTAGFPLTEIGSDYGAGVTVSAPGVNIFSLIPGGGYNDNATGTSVAAPYVSGVAALMLSVNPALTSTDLKTIIKSTADLTGNFDPEGNEIRLLDAARAVEQAQPRSCVAAPPGLVAWWKGDGNANELISGNNGALINGATFSTGEVGHAFSFNGINQYVTIPHSASLNPTQEITVEAWIRAAELPKNVWGSVVTKDNPDSGPYHLWLGHDGSVGWQVFTSSWMEIDSPPNSVSPGQFTHIAGTYNSSNGAFCVYVNGVANCRQLSGLMRSTTNAVKIGADLFNGRFFNGEIDEVSIYDRALSSSEIQTIFHAGSAGKCHNTSCIAVPSGIISWWTGDGSGIDLWSGHNGVLHGGITFTPGMVGQAFNLDGADDYVSVPSSSSLDVGLGVGLTLEAWIKPADISAEWPIIEWTTGQTNYPDTTGVHLWLSPLHDGGGPGALYGNLVDTNFGEHRIASSPGLIPADSYSHVALTYDKASGIAKLFVNGSGVAERNLGTFTPWTSTGIYFGHRPPGSCGGCLPNTYYRGMIDDLSIYDRALSTSEIQTIFHAGSAGKCSPGQL